MTAVLAPAAVSRRSAFSLGRWLEREGVFGWLMVAPPVVFLVALVGYPFFYGIWISLQDRQVAKPGVFVGLDNFIADWHNPVFWQVVVNTWRGLPFYAITLLAGLQTIPPELYEAATIDGAGRWGRFRYVTLPLLKPIIFIVTMFSVIFTFGDFQLIYVLTRGGPANATHVFATYAFDIAMGAGQFGQGAAIALSMVPPLALIILAMAIYMRPEKS